MGTTLGDRLHPVRTSSLGDRPLPRLEGSATATHKVRDHSTRISSIPGRMVIMILGTRMDTMTIVTEMIIGAGTRTGSQAGEEMIVDARTLITTDRDRRPICGRHVIAGDVAFVCLKIGQSRLAGLELQLALLNHGGNPRGLADGIPAFAG
jgi:hypothetical protein